MIGAKLIHMHNNLTPDLERLKLIVIYSVAINWNICPWNI